MNNLHDLNIERAILSAIIFEPQTLQEVDGKIEAKDFYLPFHKKIFDAFKKLDAKGLPIDEIFLQKELAKDYDEVAFLDILSANPISNVDAYLDEIVEKSRKRELNVLSMEIRKGIGEDLDSEEVINSIAKSIENIDKRAEEFDDIATIADDFVEWMDSTEEKRVIPTGLAPLDDLIDGIEEGEVIIIGARPSMGKTSGVTTMIANWIENDSCGVLFDSLEMDREKIFRRILSTMSDSTLWDLKRKQIKDLDKYKRALGKIRNSKLIIHDKNGVNFNFLRNKAKRVLRKNPDIKVWIIDHIGEISYKDPKFLRIEMGEVMSGVRAIAKEFGIGVIILSQLNREVANRKSNRPTLADLRESGELEQKADKVILLHRESYYQRGEQVREPAITDSEMIVAKNRDGATGVAKMKFEGACTRFFVDNQPYSIEYVDSVPQEQSTKSTFELPPL